MQADLQKYKGSKFIFVAGIGGSDLASKAVWNAITLHAPTEKKILFLESPDSREYEEVERFIKEETASPEEIAFLAISKSGKTMETLEAFHKTFDMLSEKFGRPISDRTIIISTEGSPLWLIAEAKGIATIAWPEGVGGRFSAFSAPHEAVMQIAGLDTDRFKQGGEAAEKGEASKLAQAVFENYNKGADILDFFIFNSELEDLGKWCRQLIAESLGKENKEGEKVGITPTVSIGPTDLHSMLQLALGGPKSRFTLFIKSNKDTSGINASAYEDAVKAYADAGLPSSSYQLEEISEFELGKFIKFMMEFTLELAKLLGVDPYGQPEVEEYKKHLAENN